MPSMSLDIKHITKQFLKDLHINLKYTLYLCINENVSKIFIAIIKDMKCIRCILNVFNVKKEQYMLLILF